MDANSWQVLSIIGFSLSGIVLIITIFIYIKFHIFSVVGDLSGRTASRQIRAIREQNINTGDKHHRPDAFNVQRGPLTDSVSKKSTKLGKTSGGKEKATGDKEKATGVLKEAHGQCEATQPLSTSDSFLQCLTGVLDNPAESWNNGTDILDNSVDTTVDAMEDATENATEDGTEVLDNEGFEIVKVILNVHSEETI